MPTELFYTDPPPEETRRICGGCAVKAECLAWALTGAPDPYGNPHNVWGVWGGTTPDDREKLLRYVRRVKCPLCQGADLRDNAHSQVCLGCGQSWPTVCPSVQARLKADTAA